MEATWKIVTAVAAGAMLAAGAAFAVVGGDHDGGRDCGKHAGRGHRFAEALGLLAGQKAQVRAIFEKHRPEFAPLRKELAAEKRVLRDMIQAGPADDASIRAQVAKLAATGADLAVRRAQVAREVRAVLTPEQAGKLEALRAERERKMDRVRERKERHDMEEQEGTN